MKGKWIGFAAVCAALGASATARAFPPPLGVYVKLIGSSNADHGYGVGLDASGNSYITGLTWGDLGGPNLGKADAFIVACNSAWGTKWTCQIGTSEIDWGHSIAVDGSGNSYIAGKTYGDLAAPNQGSYDAFIAKCDSAGTVQWTQQIGSSDLDCACGIALGGSGSAYITGHTYGDLGGPNQGFDDAFIAKCDSGGTVQWTRQIGTSKDDTAYGIAVDGSGNSYITGWTYGDLGGPNQGNADVFIAKCDSGGTVQWTRQIGTSGYDMAYGIAVDGNGNSYITGWTNGDLGGPNQGQYDAFIVKYDSGGTVQWMRQIGTSSGDLGRGIATDGSGNVFIAGDTYGGLGGPNQGASDAFYLGCDSGGTVQWVRQVGSFDAEVAEGIAVDSGGNCYVTGNRISLSGSNNAFIAFGIAARPGDATLDRCVNGLDYIVWSTNYGLSDRWWVHGDFTGEGYVDGLDYILWSNNYLVGCPGAVPEPSCALLLALGVLALRRRFGA